MKKHTFSMTISLFFSTILVSDIAVSKDFVELVQYCESCHGQNGISTTPDIPIIAGFSYEGFLNTMDVFRENDRIAMEYHKPGEPETVMNEIAQSLSDEETDELARYFSNLDFKPAKQDADKELASRGAVIHNRFCEKCHTENGRFPVEDAAILAGQWTPYLRRQFENIISGKRLVPRSMLRRVKKLSAEDIEALLNFYALQGETAR